jgi:hypothetical protein
MEAGDPDGDFEVGEANVSPLGDAKLGADDDF